MTAVHPLPTDHRTEQVTEESVVTHVVARRGLAVLRVGGTARDLIRYFDRPVAIIR